MKFLFERLHDDIKSQNNKAFDDAAIKLSDDDMSRIAQDVAKRIYEQMQSSVIKENENENEENESED